MGDRAARRPSPGTRATDRRGELGGETARGDGNAGVLALGMLSRGYLLLLLAGSLAELACECPGQVPISGRVEDEGGNPVAGALVRDCTYAKQPCIEVVTDEEGRFESGVNLDDSCEATETVEFSAEGCETRALSFPLDGESGADDVGVVTLRCPG